MTDHEQTAFFAGLTEVASIHTRRLEAHVYAAYFEALREFPLPAVLRALKESIKHCERFPKPVEIRKNLRTYEPPPRPMPSSAPRIEGPPPNPEHARESFALIQKIIGKKLTREQRLEAFKAIAAKYPGLGWEAAVDETEIPF